ncbi:MAG TPA: energy transducer TonB [Myxococcales bacterium]
MAVRRVVETAVAQPQLGEVVLEAAARVVPPSGARAPRRTPRPTAGRRASAPGRSGAASRKSSTLRAPSPAIPYPETARRRGAQGAVRLRLRVNAMGNVEEAKIVQGIDADLDLAALEAVGHLGFKPALDKGEFVSTEITYTYFLMVLPRRSRHRRRRC